MQDLRNIKLTQKAVALDYDDKSGKAPKIVAIGNNLAAEAIIKIAQEYKIPIHQDKDLAEFLSRLEVDSYIPVEVYKTVAQIIAHIYKYDKMQEK